MSEKVELGCTGKAPCSLDACRWPDCAAPTPAPPADGERAKAEAIAVSCLHMIASAHTVSSPYRDAARGAIGVFRDLVADRDEWRSQHENILAMYRAAESALALAQARIGELEGDAGRERAITTSLTTAARDVLAERGRQVTAEGWTEGYDDEHADCEMALAAACYALSAASCDNVAATRWWPWKRFWWKPSNPRRNLVKAGALILAEIERLDRAARATGGEG